MHEYDHRTDCPKCGQERGAVHFALFKVATHRIWCDVCGPVYDQEAGLDERVDKTKPACKVCGVPSNARPE